MAASTAAAAAASPCCCRHLPSVPSVTGSARFSTANSSHRSAKTGSASAGFGFLPSPHPVHYGLSSSLILRFPPNFVRQLSTKARRNCSNIGVAQIVAASWSNPSKGSTFSASAAVDGASAAAVTVVEAASASVDGAPAPVTEVEAAAAAQAQDVVGKSADGACSSGAVIVVQNADGSADSLPGEGSPVDELFRFDGSLAVHAGERLGRGIVTDGITTPVVNTSAYWFKNSAQLIDFKEGRHASFEYGRYGNPTTKALEEKMSALEKAESTLFMASGMYASVSLMQALVPAGGHIITTTDCYRKTRIYMENELPKMGVTVTVIDPADIDSLKRALDDHNVSLFFTETPTNPLFRCVDIELVSKLCHDKGALVCIDSTFATPLNQKALTLGADIVLHSATKYINGHNDVIAGCISGSEELIAKVRKLHFVIGGVLNPNASSMILRGMKTLHLRVQHQNTSAMRMAQFLEAHPKILRVYYPGLPSHREHHIAKKQMKGFGGVVSFEVAGDLAATSKFIDSLRIPYNAPSFGGCESIIDQPAIMSYWDLCSADRAKYGIKDNLVRFSIGIEDFEDLKADVAQALERI